MAYTLAQLQSRLAEIDASLTTLRATYNKIIAKIASSAGIDNRNWTLHNPKTIREEIEAFMAEREEIVAGIEGRDGDGVALAVFGPAR